MAAEKKAEAGGVCVRGRLIKMLGGLRPVGSRPGYKVRGGVCSRRSRPLLSPRRQVTRALCMPPRRAPPYMFACSPAAPRAAGRQGAGQKRRERRCRGFSPPPPRPGRSEGRGRNQRVRVAFPPAAGARRCPGPWGCGVPGGSGAVLCVSGVIPMEGRPVQRQGRPVEVESPSSGRACLRPRRGQRRASGGVPTESTRVFLAARCAPTARAVRLCSSPAACQSG